MDVNFLGILFVFIMISVYSLHGIFLKFYTRNYPGAQEDATSVYSVILGFTTAVITLAVNLFKFEFSWLAVLFGVFMGIMVVLYNYFLATAPDKGPYSLVMIFSLSGGILFPIIAAAIGFGSIPRWIQFLGIGVMFVAFVLLCVDFKDKTQAQQGFYPLCIGICLSNGSYAAVTMLEEKIEASAHSTEMIVTTYVTAALIAFIALAFQKKTLPVKEFRQTPKSMLFAILGAGTITAGINLLIVCLSLVDESVLYTVQSGGILVMSAFLSLIFFKEKISLQKWIGIIIAAVSMVLLAI